VPIALPTTWAALEKGIRRTPSRLMRSAGKFEQIGAFRWLRSKHRVVSTQIRRQGAATRSGSRPRHS
jgi:hypothetical protein